MHNKKLDIGKMAIVEYFIQNKKILVKRNVIVISEDNEYYYVNTGYLTNTPILKKNIIKAEYIK